MISEVKEFDLFITALHFAAMKHRDQRRKDASKTPYINHPVAVAETLWSIGQVRDIVVLTAALLHDTIEDTATTADDIRKQFGEEVLAVVLELSDDKSLPKEERKELQVKNAPHKSPRARQVSLSDKINNVSSLICMPPSDWSQQRKREYLDWAERVVNGMRGPNPLLEAEFDRVLAEGRRELSHAR
jgi:guanosine-3',5'-bis(diphosphate) 3'-pyrophosphohydrolase